LNDDLFLIFEENDLCNFADDSSLSAFGPILDTDVIIHLQDSAIKILKWFDQNSSQIQVIFAGSPNLDGLVLNLNGYILKSSK